MSNEAATGFRVDHIIRAAKNAGISALNKRKPKLTALEKAFYEAAKEKKKKGRS